jgi:hypothetical protein
MLIKYCDIFLPHNDYSEAQSTIRPMEMLLANHNDAGTDKFKKTAVGYLSKTIL